ncbi:MAG: ATP-dependent Clp protease ATP-binding subunit [Clostridia bacterium]|nr:ATP-dependent Clp protease ATP-binding subunit [Clostridia bacterium]
MALCSVCKKNTAVVFVNKIVDGKPNLEGLCLACAKKRGINPLATMMKEYGASDVDIENMNKQFDEIVESMQDMDIDPEALENMGIDGMPNFNDIDANGQSDGKNPVNAISDMFNNLLRNMGSKDEASATNSGDNSTANSKKKEKADKKKKYLDAYGTNLTKKAKEGNIDKLIGREQELDRMIQILNRRSKNNPCLIGEPGVGKTAIANGLALKIASHEVPAKLMNYEIYLLDMTAMVAGTQFRGQFEARMKGLIEECKALGNIILVIDEIHNIVGAGETEHSMNAANILKPALANGEIQIIGATTLKEYRKYIEKDSALERRFQPIIVDEPSIDQTIEILKGIKSYYEEYHKVIVSDEMIRKIVIMSEKYIHDRFLPDKAIDILDEACSKLNLTNKVLAQLAIMKDELEQVKEEKEALEVIDAEHLEPDFEKIANLRVRENTLTNQIADLSQGNLTVELNVEDVARVIETWTKIPASKITETEAAKLLNLENTLHKRLIGQDNAVSAVANAIRRSRAGLKIKKCPPSFIFVGPTGVGKTELAKALASELFGTEESIVRVDMSEYMESHSVSKLIGSPPGYVGYDDAGQLTEKIRRNPYSLILFDEIEKAHHDVFNLLLQVLDEGRLTDAQGRVVSFENTIIIMTSNAGSNLNSNGIGFNREESKLVESRVMAALKDTFRPEFLNRIDETIIFHELTRDELLQIVDLMLNELSTELKEKNINITFSKEVREYILDKGYEPKYGARPLRRAIEKYIENVLAEGILKDEIIPNEEVVLILSPENEVVVKAK